MKLQDLLASSANPKQLSLTVTGALSLIVPLAALVIKATGHDVDNATLQNIVAVIGDAVFAIGTAVSSIMMVVGVIRKLVIAFQK